MTKPQQRLAAAKYLCADNRHLVRAILAYNNSLDYAPSVYGFAQLTPVTPEESPEPPKQ